MPCIYTVQLPAVRSADLPQVYDIMGNWVNSNPYNSFSGFDFASVKHRHAVSCQESDLTFLRAHNPRTLTSYLALRTDTELARKDGHIVPANLRWRADFIAEYSPRAMSFLIRLHRSPSQPDKPADMNIPVAIPYPIKLLVREGLLEPDCGIPFSLAPLTANGQLIGCLNDIVANQRCTSVPIITVKNREEAQAAAIAKRMSGAAHVIWFPAESELVFDLVPDGVTVLYPRIMLRRSFPDGPEQAEAVFDCAMRATHLAATRDGVTYEQIDEWSRQQDTEDSGEQNTELPRGYICMNREMADLIRTNRIRNGITQAELAQKAQTTGLTISRLETFRTTRVQDRLLQAIENALNLKPGEISALESNYQAPQPNGQDKSSYPLPEPNIMAAPAASAAPAPAMAAASSIRFCPQCGAKLLDGAKFCHQCGTPKPGLD